MLNLATSLIRSSILIEYLKNTLLMFTNGNISKTWVILDFVLSGSPPYLVQRTIIKWLRTQQISWRNIWWGLLEYKMCFGSCSGSYSWFKVYRQSFRAINYTKRVQWKHIFHSSWARWHDTNTTDQLIIVDLFKIIRDAFIVYNQFCK